MYVDQHTLEKMGTARLIARYAPDYTDYLGKVFGRPFYLSGPVEIKGTTRLLATFFSDEVASGEDRSPMIKLWIEFNPAMGLYTVWGEFWKSNEAPGPLYKSSPRTGFDDELLGDPARVFDWLDQSVSMGEARSPKEKKMPQGKVFRFSLDGLERFCFHAKDEKDARSKVLDWLLRHGMSMYRDEVVIEEGPCPPSHIHDEWMGRKKYEEGRSWYASEILRMAGADGSERMADRRLNDDLLDEKSRKQQRAAKKAEKVAPPKKVGPFSTAMTPERAKLAKTLKSNPNVRDPERLAFWIGLRMAGKKGGTNESQESVMQFPNIGAQLEAIRIALEGKMQCDTCGSEVMAEEAVEMDDGEMLCEGCASEMEEGIEYDDEDLEEEKGPLLAKVPSSSDPSKSYEIRMGKDGNVYCDCPAWKYQKVPPKERTCKHIKSLYKAMDSQAKLKLPKEVKEGTAFPLSGGEFLVLAEDLDVIAEMLSENSDCGCDDAEMHEAEFHEAQSKFKKLVSKLKKRGDVKDPAALASWIGAKKMGKGNVEKGRKMLQKMAVKARKGGK